MGHASEPVGSRDETASPPVQAPARIDARPRAVVRRSMSGLVAAACLAAVYLVQNPPSGTVLDGLVSKVAVLGLLLPFSVALVVALDLAPAAPPMQAGMRRASRAVEGVARIVKASLAVWLFVAAIALLKLMNWDPMTVVGVIVLAVLALLVLVSLVRLLRPGGWAAVRDTWRPIGQAAAARFPTARLFLGGMCGFLAAVAFAVVQTQLLGLSPLTGVDIFVIYLVPFFLCATIVQIPGVDALEALVRWLLKWLGPPGRSAYLPFLVTCAVVEALLVIFFPDIAPVKQQLRLTGFNYMGWILLGALELAFLVYCALNFLRPQAQRRFSPLLLGAALACGLLVATLSAAVHFGYLPASLFAQVVHLMLG